MWFPYLEAVLVEGLENYQPGESVISRSFGLFPMRSKSVSDYIFQITGKRRTPKQVPPAATSLTPDDIVSPLDVSSILYYMRDQSPAVCRLRAPHRLPLTAVPRSFSAQAACSRTSLDFDSSYWLGSLM
ncbi:hypothetical protein L227DRAFT_618111 [Lentinus tigrinus ALCF2SS1-6]|uniref:TEA domain-containing protein n=1 Tax=Lentinus tigrinus ALCF2SS1-6 TaxID=1328759 RepID=A0A5C2RKM1_9APHY|nr:hypothetical protein L227DRAFT_618111 [Lentinus tigrinus ALCF2SS1-6]